VLEHCQELLAGSRLGQEAVRAEGQGQVALGQDAADDDGQRLAEPMLAQPTQEVPTIHLGQHDVEHDQIRLQPLYLGEDVVWVVQRDEVEGAVAQVALPEVEGVLVVLDSQDARAVGQWEGECKHCRSVRIRSLDLAPERMCHASSDR